MSEGEGKRFEVTVQRKVIVYAETPDDAGRKAMVYLKLLLEQPATRPISVVEVKELPPVEEEPRGEIVDNAPGRETRA
jgi:hypothetical protein